MYEENLQWETFEDIVLNYDTDVFELWISIMSTSTISSLDRTKSSKRRLYVYNASTRSQVLKLH